MTIEFNSDHKDPKDSQLLVALTGSPEYIRDKLLDMADQCVTSYGKPIQGQTWSTQGSSHVITPVWREKNIKKTSVVF